MWYHIDSAIYVPLCSNKIFWYVLCGQRTFRRCFQIGICNVLCVYIYLICIYISVCIYMCIYIYIYIYICIYMCMHACMHVYMYGMMHTYIHTYICDGNDSPEKHNTFITLNEPSVGLFINRSPEHLQNTLLSHRYTKTD